MTLLIPLAMADDSFDATRAAIHSRATVGDASTVL
jgi:hypothetical protein